MGRRILFVSALWLGGCVSGSVSGGEDGAVSDAAAEGDDARAQPERCPAQADCSGRACGPDPVCGATCGACPPQFECAADGACDCVGGCLGRVCGDDGCGGTCGRCGPGEICLAGQCNARPDDCPEARDCAGRECGLDPVCGESCGGCGPAGVCRDGACQCTPFCEGRACGDDGCGGACGLCPQGEVCDAGQCVDAPAACPEAADCEGLSCGPDPACGTSCGRCAEGDVCQAGACRCLRDCRDKNCGDDACGGTCGVCPEGQACDDGRCACEPDCAGRVCGPDGCGGQCGGCPAGTVCTAGACGCRPECEGRVCGDDACGGVCGVCREGEACGDGECECPGEVCGRECCGGDQLCGAEGCCETRWTRAQVGLLGLAAASADGSLFVGGRRGADAVIAKFDRCGHAGGERVLRLDNAVNPSVNAVFVDGDGLLVGGGRGGTAEAPLSGFWARLRQDDLSVEWSTPLFGAADRTAAVTSIERDFQGDIWMAGVVGAAQPNATFWGLHGDRDAAGGGRACGWSVGGAPAAGRVVRPSADRRAIYMAGTLMGQLAVRGFDANCQWGGRSPCDCPATFSANARPAGADTADGRAMVVNGANLDVFGVATIGGIAGAFASRIRLADGQIVSDDLWNPSPALGDGYFTAHRDPGGRYLVGGVRGLNGFDLSSGQGVLVTMNAQLQRTGVRAIGPGVVFDIVPTGAGDLFVLRTGTDRTWIQRCSAAGDCVP